MKLFLASLVINDSQAVELAKLVGKDQKDIKLALIENAADAYPEGNRAWVDDNRAAITSHDFDVEIIDIRRYKDKLDELKARLMTKDVIWFGGGNTYYLRWLLKNIGLDATLPELLNTGIVYGGGSAGAIVAGPTLKHFEPADDPSEAPEAIMDGLSLTGTVVVPHMDNPKFASVISAINDALVADGYNTAPLGDAQTLIVNGVDERIV